MLLPYLFYLLIPFHKHPTAFLRLVSVTFFPFSFNCFPGIFFSSRRYFADIFLPKSSHTLNFSNQSFHQCFILSVHSLLFVSLTTFGTFLSSNFSLVLIFSLLPFLSHLSTTHSPSFLFHTPYIPLIL